jgi:hypothetical protein
MIMDALIHLFDHLQLFNYLLELLLHYPQGLLLLVFLLELFIVTV